MHTYIFQVENVFGIKESILFIQAIKVRFSPVLDSKNALHCHFTPIQDTLN